MGKIFRDDIGTEIIIDMQTDLTTATNVSIAVEKPDGTKTTWTPSIINTTHIKYIIKEGDFSISGVYNLQPRLTIGSWSGSGTECDLTVYNKV
jgi:hypothetical protein